MGNFSATSVGQPLCCSSTDPCAAGWKAVNDEVAKVDAMPDIRDRNKAISASYANLYVASPDLRWAGTAAFASKQVGCGMDTAHTYLDDYPGGIAQAAQDMAANGGGIDPVSAAMYDARQTLGAGNLAVYDELYLSLRFYQENKGTMTSQQIMSCVKNKPGTPVDPSLTKGLQQTMDGHGTDGAITMLMHEQQDTLQKTAYDSSWMFRRSLDVSRLTGYPPVQLVMSADCSSGDASKIVDFKNFPGPLYDFQSRWPFAKACANQFVSLADAPSSGPSILRSLHAIADAFPGP